MAARTSCMGSSLVTSTLDDGVGAVDRTTRCPRRGAGAVVVAGSAALRGLVAGAPRNLRHGVAQLAVVLHERAPAWPPSGPVQPGGSIVWVRSRTTGGRRNAVFMPRWSARRPAPPRAVGPRAWAPRPPGSSAQRGRRAGPGRRRRRTTGDINDEGLVVDDGVEPPTTTWDAAVGGLDGGGGGPSVRAKRLKAARQARAVGGLVGVTGRAMSSRCVAAPCHVEGLPAQRVGPTVLSMSPPSPSRRRRRVSASTAHSSTRLGDRHVAPGVDPTLDLKSSRLGVAAAGRRR